MSLVLLLAVVALADRLPGLVERLEVEDIDAPGENAAHRFLPVPLGIFGLGHGSLVVGSAIWVLISFLCRIAAETGSTY